VKMPHSQKWQQILTWRYDPLSTIALVSKAQDYYEGYCSQLTFERNRANRVTLKTRVFPGLSIFKALFEEIGDREEALAEVDNLFRAAFFTQRMQGIRILNLLPNPFPIVRPVLKLMTRGSYSSDSQEIVEDSSDCFAYNVYRCFIYDTLKENHAAELTALYCKTDDWLSEAVPKIRWGRTKTLGRGDDFCDFRWCRIK